MAGQNVQTFTDANFDSEVLKSDKPVLVDFWAEWCGPCRMLSPTIDALAGKFDGRAKIGKVDVDTNRQLAATYGIAAIPTVMLFKGGHPVKVFRGLTNEATLTGAIEGAMA